MKVLSNQYINKDKNSCWVCGVRFKTSIPPGPALKEEHHVVPRAFGGTDGPTVLLCDTHHATLHKIANKVKSKADFKILLLGEPKDRQQKLCWLASMVVKSEEAVAGDPNKLLRNTVMLTPLETQMMNKLQALYSEKNRSDLFRLGLSLLYKKHFGPK